MPHNLAETNGKTAMMYVGEVPWHRLGTKAVDRIIATRRVTSIRLSDLARLHIPRNKALPFIVLSDHRPSTHLLDSARLMERFKPKPSQLGFGF